MIKDPVCGMTVNPQHAAASVRYKGQTYYFCSQMCKTLFEREPEKYLKAGETYYFCSLGCKKAFDENPEKYLGKDEHAHHY